MSLRKKVAALALAVIAAAAILPASARAADTKNAAAAEKTLSHLTSGRQWKNDYTGEDFAWQTAYDMNTLLHDYETTKDPVYLDAAVKFYDAILAKMQTGPDGYKGFIGPFEYNNKFWCDDHVGDAILLDGILDFSTLVMRTPELKQKYSAKALDYANVAKKDFFEKWDSRKTYHTDGPFGFYVGWDQFGEAHDLKNWKPHPEDKACASESNLSLPFNKDIDCGALALRIWQVTGDEKYKQRAEELFGYMKSRMQNFNGAYHWNYWEPSGQWDLAVDHADLVKSEWNPALVNKTYRLWTAVHPERNYQSNELANIVLAYNAGLVFTEADIKGMLQTNLKVMWNGDKDHPLFANSNADLLNKMGKPESYAGKHAGEAWAPLAQFSPVYHEIYPKKFPETAPSFERKFAPTDDRLTSTPFEKIPEVYVQFPLGNVRTINMAAALPSVFAEGQSSAIVCKLLEPGDLEVALYSPDGKNKIAVLKQGHVAGGSDGREGISYFLWNGALPDNKTAAPGNYRIRWTVANDGYREFPITIQAKE